MRLIDKDALLDKAEEYYKAKERESAYTGNREICVRWDDAIIIINEAEPVEPQRIKGRWNQDSYNDEKYVCDKCGEPCATYVIGKPRDRFCKWCGADMRGEDDETD